MRIDGDTEIDGSPEPIWPVNVTGVGGQYDISAPYDSGYQLLPRFISDFEETGGNQFPVADGGGDQVVSPGVLVTLDATGSYDPDGAIVGYIWEQTTGENIVLSDYEEPVVTFTAPATEGVLGFSLTAIDELGSMATDGITVMVYSGNISIYDIQYTTGAGSGNDCFPSPYVSVGFDDYVIVSGVVTGVTWGTSHYFFIQDPAGDEWSGVYVYDATVDPQIGDEMILAAQVDEYYGFTELSGVAGFVTQSTGNTLQPIDITTAELGNGCSETGERLEGVLVRVSDVTVTSEASTYGEWFVQDASGVSCQIDDNVFAGTPYSPTLGETIDYIIGVVDYSYSEYAILPRSMDDLGVQIVTTSVYDIQYTTVPGDGTYPSLLDGQPVTVSGIVSAANYYSSGNANRFFITDPEGGAWHGVFVFNYDAIVTGGDWVTVSGTVSEYYGFTEISDVTSVVIQSSDNEIPAASSVSTNDVNSEMYEGVLVRVENVTVTAEPDTHSEWYVDDGSGAVQIDDGIFQFPNPTLGMAFDSITGAVDYSFDAFGINPRWESDVVPSGSGCTANGDVTGDGALDVMDIVAVVSHVLGNTILPPDVICHADMDDSGTVDVLDIVNLVDMILNPTIRQTDAKKVSLFIGDHSVWMTSDGFIGGIQMTLSHDPKFSLNLTDHCYLSDQNSDIDNTRLIVLHPDSEIFTYTGEFTIDEVTVVSRSDYLKPVIVNKFKLLDNFPNPFNPTTTIQFQLPESNQVKVFIYDLSGRLMDTLMDNQIDAGYHSVVWDATGYASGIYLVRMEAGDLTAMQKIALVK